MYRSKMEELKKWKESSNRKPLIIRGARQVGKTWLMKEFGKECYEKCAYINFDDNARMNKLFDEDFDLDTIIQGLKIESGVNIEPENTLIILDEIQETPKALKALKYICERISYSISRFSFRSSNTWRNFISSWKSGFFRFDTIKLF